MSAPGDVARERVPRREADRPGPDELEGLGRPMPTAPPAPWETCPW